MKNEFLAGLTAFATIAYIIIVNPQILSRAGLEFESVMAATILTAALATFLMGIYANYPFVLAPGMGLNAYFTYGIVLGEGFSWETALGICFISGIIVLALNLLGFREAILDAVPKSLRLASTAGIGLFLLFIGFQNVGLIAAHTETLVTLGAVKSLPVLLATGGVILTAALMALNIRSALFIGIFSVSIASWLLGAAPWNGILATPALPEATFWKFNLLSALQPEAWPIIVTFVFIALFDTAGTVFALAEQGGFIREGKIPRIRRVLTCDALGTVAGGALGTSPVTTYLESASGIAAGGRSGVTAIVTSLLLLLTLFFSPLITSIPLFATAPALIIIGALMLRSATRINWEDPAEYLPASIVIASIPLTYSIADGIALGFITYPFIKLLCGRLHETNSMLWVIAAFFIMRFTFL